MRWRRFSPVRRLPHATRERRWRHGLSPDLFYWRDGNSVVKARGASLAPLDAAYASRLLWAKHTHAISVERDAAIFTLRVIKNRRAGFQPLFYV